MRIEKILVTLSILVLASTCFADEPMQHHSGSASKAPLTAPGNDAFGAIQEVVEKLMANPDTDWSRVNLEGLRRHLVDMDNFTLHVKVTAQKPIKGGLEFTVIPTTTEATGSLQRLFSAHPSMLKQESGWDMQVKPVKDGYTARVTSDKPGDVAKIRGLGYIGIIALGKHHQLHHWQMATGVNPHQHHHQ